MYGITKVFNELLGVYYHSKFGLDFRCLRYPGVVSSTRPHGGTSDYSVEMFFAALEKDHSYTCYLEEHQEMPMIYIDDLITGTLQFIEADRKSLTDSVYNI